MGKRADTKNFDPTSFGARLEPRKQVGTKIFFLIVCEGTKTEPNYFQSFTSKQSGNTIFIETFGTATNTIQVVQKAIDLRNNAAKDYDAVWAVFDKDNFSAKDFNAAIQLAEREQIGCAWTNEAFELWYLLHFVNRTTPMSRKDYQKAIEAQLKKKAGHSYQGYTYKKNDEKMLQRLQEYGNEAEACKRALRLEKEGQDTYPNRFADQNPCTTVFKLVQQLRGQDNDFKQKVTQSST